MGQSTAVGQSVEVFFGSIVGQSPIAHSCGSGRGAVSPGGVMGQSPCGAVHSWQDVGHGPALWMPSVSTTLWGRAPRGGTYGAEPHVEALMGQSPT